MWIKSSERRMPAGSVSHARSLVRRWCSDTSGATAIEYGLICALIFMVILSGVQGVANGTRDLHNNIANNM